MDSRGPQRLDNEDLEAAFYSAFTLLGIRGYSVIASFEPFSSVRSNARIDRNRLRLAARVSDAYCLASREVLLGLALDFCCKLFHKSISNEYTDEFARFASSGALYKLSDSMRMLRGNRRHYPSKGEFYDLGEIGRMVFERYARVLGIRKMPKLRWNARGGRRILAFYDRAFDEVLVSCVFDSSKVPRIVIEYLCYHEFLHAKYQPLYERGKSRRVIVHSHAFRKDEKNFEGYAEADRWIERNVGRLG